VSDPSRPAGAIDAVVFDFGGVFTPSPFDAVGTMGDVAGIPRERAMEFVFGPYDRDTDHPWHQAERGEMALADVRTQVLEAAAAEGLEIDLYDMLKYMSGSGIRDEMVERARRLHADGYRTGMITNNVAEFREFWRPMLPLDELFDVVIDSHEVAMRKPDPRIFALVLEQLGGVEPSRAVFLDDYPGNVAAAEACGWQGILVGADYLDAIARLDALLAAGRPDRTA
jgi:putative hydrolase of the HAD superfamily